jgi:hypothetical protein
MFLLLAPLLLSFWVEGLNFIAAALSSSGLTYFGLGLLISALLGAILGGAVTGFLETTLHELTHACVGCLLVGPITYIEARSNGGLTEVEGHNGCNPFLLFYFLAPYCIPLSTLPFLIAKPFVAQ